MHLYMYTYLYVCLFEMAHQGHPNLNISIILMEIIGVYAMCLGTWEKPWRTSACIAGP
jgi:hypothetical protein